ncbi:MAG: hypothetical protein HOI23_13990 [Deltaproteobacteria bacterium]|nr:hypothetical protein [Deltaproteobacteria bacterium]MBT6434827.1 hypothetical protein [Deltaproteobacteria bacterium]
MIKSSINGSLLVFVVAALVGCIHTKAGTHVEILDQDGKRLYVSGAAGPGVSQTIACKNAVQRAASAVAHRFAQEESSIGSDVAEAMGASDGAPFLYGYANHTVMHSTVQDVTFDPGASLCMATVRWQPPVFLKEAIVKFALGMKQRELEEADNVAAAEAGRPVVDDKRASTPVPAAIAVPCRKETKKALKAGAELDKQRGYFDECKRRTGNDLDVCHAYQLRFEEAERKANDTLGALNRCKELQSI